MRSQGSGLRLPFAIISIFASLLLIFLSRTDLGNWLKKSDYAQWSQLIEAELTTQNAEMLLVDFGTLPEDDEEFYVVVEIAEPEHEYELERLFADVQRIIIQTYLLADPQPSQPDSIAVLLALDSGMRMGVVGPFSGAMEYVQTGSGYDTWVDTWQFGLEFSEEFEVEE